MSHRCRVSGHKAKRMRLKALSGLLPLLPCAHIGNFDGGCFYIHHLLCKGTLVTLLKIATIPLKILRVKQLTCGSLKGMKIRQSLLQPYTCQTKPSGVQRGPSQLHSTPDFSEPAPMPPPQVSLLGQFPSFIHKSQSLYCINQFSQLSCNVGTALLRAEEFKTSHDTLL